MLQSFISQIEQRNPLWRGAVSISPRIPRGTFLYDVRPAGWATVVLTFERQSFIALRSYGVKNRTRASTHYQHQLTAHQKKRACVHKTRGKNIVLSDSQSRGCTHYARTLITRVGTVQYWNITLTLPLRHPPNFVHVICMCVFCSCSLSSLHLTMCFHFVKYIVRNFYVRQQTADSIPLIAQGAYTQ